MPVASGSEISFGTVPLSCYEMVAVLSRKGDFVTSDGLFTLLSFAPCGVYAVTMDQSVVFWNRAAERITGHLAHEIIGRKCYEIGAAPNHRGLTEECVAGCALMKHVRAGLVPARTRVRLLCSDGQRKWVAVNPMVVDGVVGDAPLMIHLFDETPGGLERTGSSLADVVEGAEGRYGVRTMALEGSVEVEHPGLSRREMQVLYMLSEGRDNAEISTALSISLYTVRNHVRNVRKKLGAATKLEAVVNAVRMGVITLK